MSKVLARLSHASNLARRGQPTGTCTTVSRLNRLSSIVEPLESRTMMSAVHATPLAHVKLQPAKSAALILSVPSALTIAATSPNSVKLGWTEAAGSAIGYKVLRSAGGGSFAQAAQITNAATLSYTDTQAVANTLYVYKVEAYNSTATSSASATVTLRTPLIAPTTLTAAVQSGTKISLTWRDQGDSASGYKIYRSVDAANFTLCATLSGNSIASYSDTTVTSGKAYEYQVQAVTSTNTSAMSGPAKAVTPLAAPSGLSASAQASTVINLNWTDNDSAATGYLVLRSTNGVNFALTATLTTANAVTFSDKTASASTHYYYQVEAINSVAASPASAVESATTPLAVPTILSAMALNPLSVKLIWADTDSAATGYIVLRSSGGSSFAQVGVVNSGATTTWIDNTVSTDTAYSYEIAAQNAAGRSAASSAATVTTPLSAPINLTASAISASSVTLIWTDTDSTATGYNILRSNDGVNFHLLTSLSGGSTTTWTDTTATAASTSYFQVEATAASATSASSNSASATTSSSSSVTITTRYGDELVVTATGRTDLISVAQSGSMLTIVADGQTTTQSAPAAGLFIYTRGGTDNVNIDSSVTVRTTVESIDTGIDDITAAGSNVSVWDDSSDICTGSATLHTVSAFAGGTAKTSGASLADPKDAGTIMHMTGSLWGTGPVAGDVNQGQAGDCYFLSSLAAFAGEQPALLQGSAVDMGDGTYTVQFISNGSPDFIRVSNDISTSGGGNYKFARPGSSGSVWAVVMEKAFAYFRTGANTYASISSGWMGEAYADLGVNSTYFMMSGTGAATFYNTVSTALSNGNEVTLGTSDSPPNLVGGHAYTLVSCTLSNGVATYVVRNPWGVSGDSLENSQGYATLTFAQMQANFVDCCVAL